jgi:mRNA interferase HigB
MRIIIKTHIHKASEQFPNAKKALETWFHLMKTAEFNSFNEVKAVFASADLVGRVIVFDIRGNHYRLISAIHYNTKTVYILEVLTHEEYDKDQWKKRYKIYD